MHLLEISNLQTYFDTRRGVVKAVDGFSARVEKGKTLAIVGESGSGKSVAMMSMLDLIPKPPGRIVGGSALFKGSNLLTMSANERRRLLGNKIGMVFQDPMTSLNPYLRVSTQLIEGQILHKGCSKVEARRRALEVLEYVGIPEAKRRLDAYPHELSGGMRQRVMIAMALVCEPELLIADEPTTALDVTVQAQILALLKDIQKEKDLGLILISHDLGMVAGMSDEVVVMYAGRTVESGRAEQIFYETAHPYTRGLLKSVLRVDSPIDQPIELIEGMPPDPGHHLQGCLFAPRCKYVKRECSQDEATVRRTASEGHYYSCLLAKGFL